MRLAKDLGDVAYSDNVAGVDWPLLKLRLIEDAFDNGRTPEQLRLSFEHSYAVCLARNGNEIVGTARALSDGVCNAYVVDVWTYTPLRRRGVGREMMRRVLARLEGQHVYLFSDDQGDFYRAIGFRERAVGYETVVGTWLVKGLR
jgi:GNAT superfamily N-acetyltransferase